MTTITHSYRSEDIRFSYAIIEPCSDIVPHVHDVWELIFLKKGDISYLVEGKIYHPGKNCLIISRPWERHAITFHNSETYSRYNIVFDEKLLLSNVCKKLPHNIDVINFDGNELVCGLFQKLSYYSEHFDGDTMKALLINLTEEILCNVVIVSKEFEASDICSVNPIINQAVKYINDHITTWLNIETLADHLFITKSHLHHLFMKHLKITPKKYILSKKLILAQRDLRSGSKPTEVCANYGFSDYSTFYRDYKHYFGHSPSTESNVAFLRDIES